MTYTKEPNTNTGAPSTEPHLPPTTQGVDARTAVQLDEEALVRKAFDTDPKEGIEILFRMYYSPLCSFAARIVYSKAVAEDLVSELFYQFYVREAYAGVTSSFRAYLLKTVQNRCFNYLKRDAQRSAYLDDVEDVRMSPAQEADRILEYEELSQAYEKVISELPTQRRRIFLMHRFEDRKYAEIATELGISPRTVEVQIRKASHHIRRVLAKWADVLLTIACLMFVSR